MKKYFLSLIFLSTALFVQAEDITSNCTFQGIPLYGRVKIVNTNQDFNVKLVDFASNLRVKRTAVPPITCGEWQFVDTKPDFTVKFVDFAWDFTIQYVDFLPGLQFAR